MIRVNISTLAHHEDSKNELLWSSVSNCDKDVLRKPVMFAQRGFKHRRRDKVVSVGIDFEALQDSLDHFGWSVPVGAVLHIDKRPVLIFKNTPGIAGADAVHPGVRPIASTRANDTAQTRPIEISPQNWGEATLPS